MNSNYNSFRERERLGFWIGRKNKTSKVRILNEWTDCYQTPVVTRNKGYCVEREGLRFQAQNPYPCRSVL